MFRYATILLVSCPLALAQTANFESVPLIPESAYYGQDNAGGFTDAGAFFNNTYTDFGGGFFAWQGWAVSNITDNTTPGFDNQFSAFAGSGAAASANYGVAYSFNPGDATIDLPAGITAQSMQLTNTTYAALTMLNGDGFAKQFGGPTGDDPDFFKLNITGLDTLGTPLNTIEFFLADYRFADNSLDYIIEEWTTVDLTPLAGAARLSFGFESSDVGQFGINTPTYFAMDNLILVPEPAAFTLLALASCLALRKRGA